MPFLHHAVMLHAGSWEGYISRLLWWLTAASPVLQAGHSVDGCRRLAFLPRLLSLGQYEWVGLLSDDS